MSAVDDRFQSFVRDHTASGPGVDPLPYLENLAGADRDELAALIDGFLARRPRRDFDPEAFAGSHAENLAERLHRSLHGDGGLWPVVLPALRAQAGLERDALAPQLAQALGVSNRVDKVREYLEHMEHGRLAAAGVSDRVLDALAPLVQSSPNALRAAGSGGFAVQRAAAPSGGGTDWDEVDELFRGAAG